MSYEQLKKDAERCLEEGIDMLGIKAEIVLRLIVQRDALYDSLESIINEVGCLDPDGWKRIDLHWSDVVTANKALNLTEK